MLLTDWLYRLQAADECVSHILLMEGRGSFVHKVVRVLERSGAVVDPVLRRISEAERKDLDLGQCQSLCHSMKATGVCQ